LKKIFLILTFFVSLPAFALDNSTPGKILSFESRSNGLHAIFFDQIIPPQGCTLSDRAVIVESDLAGKTLIAVTLSALGTNKNVVIQVDGCTPITTTEDTSAPKVTKIQLYNN